MTQIPFRYESASARLIFLDPGLYALSNVWASVKGQGHGEGVMEQVISYADEHRIVVKLLVQRYGNPNQGGLDNYQLEEFYAKFGFRRDPDPFNRRPYCMTRQPRENYMAPSEKDTDLQRS